MAFTLSKGAIKEWCDAPPTQVGFAPGTTLQLVAYKTVPVGNQQPGQPPQDRFRLALSDGEHSTNSLASVEVSRLVAQGTLEKYAVIAVTNSIATPVPAGGRRVPVIMAVDILGNPGERLGEPKAYDPAASASAQQQQQPQPAYQQQQPAYQQQQQPQSAYQAPRPQQPAYGQAPPAGAAGMQQYSAPNPYAAHTPAGGASAPSQDEGITPIAVLTPYNNAWSLRGRITQKGDVKHYQGREGKANGKLFSFVLADETCDIRITCFNEHVDRFQPLVQLGKVYKVSNGMVKQGNPRFNSTGSQYEITAGRETNIEEVHGAQAQAVPLVQLNRVTLGALGDMAPQTLVDVLGVVEEVGDVGTIISKATSREMTKRDVTLVDESKFAVRLTLWGGMATDMPGLEVGCTLAAKNVKLGDFGGRSLSALNSSQILVSPDMPEAHAVLGWYQQQRRGELWQTHSNAAGGMGGGAGGPGGRGDDPVTPLADVAGADFASGSDKGVYYTAEVFVTHVRSQTLAYPACPTCTKKVVDVGSGWRCDKCDATLPHPQYRYVASVCAADASGQVWLQVFDDVGKVLFGRPADEIMHARNQGMTEQAQAMADEPQYKQFRVRVRAKQEIYNEEARARHTIIEITPLDSTRPDALIKAAAAARAVVRQYEGGNAAGAGAAGGAAPYQQQHQQQQQGYGGYGAPAMAAAGGAGGYGGYGSYGYQQ